MIKIPKKGKYVRLKYYERNIKSSFMVYADFESILIPEDNGRQNPESLVQTNTKNMLLAAIIINKYVLMITSVSLLCHI